MSDPAVEVDESATEESSDEVELIKPKRDLTATRVPHPMQQTKISGSATAGIRRALSAEQNARIRAEFRPTRVANMLKKDVMDISSSDHATSEPDEGPPPPPSSGPNMAKKRCRDGSHTTLSRRMSPKRARGNEYEVGSSSLHLTGKIQPVDDETLAWRLHEELNRTEAYASTAVARTSVAATSALKGPGRENQVHVPSNALSTNENSARAGVLMNAAAGNEGQMHSADAAQEEKETEEEEELTDSQLARKLQQEDEAAEFERKKQEDSDALYARVVQQDEEFAHRLEEKRKGFQAGREPESKIAFKVVMDADGNTLEGDEDADNLAHLALVKQDFHAVVYGQRHTLKIKTVTYFVNFTLNRRFESAKEKLVSQGRDVTERTLFHGTKMQNIDPILAVRVACLASCQAGLYQAERGVTNWQDGFKVGGVKGASVVNGSVYGLGVYLAHAPVMSSGCAQKLC